MASRSRCCRSRLSVVTPVLSTEGCCKSRLPATRKPRLAIAPRWKVARDLAAYTRPAVVYLCLPLNATNVELHHCLKPRFAKRNQGFGGSASVTEVAVNFKIGVQRVRLNLCKSGLGTAYRARVYRLEHRRLGSERRILNTHVRSFRPTLVRCGLMTLDQQIFLELNRNTCALGFGVSNHPVSSNSNEESV